MDGIDEAVKNVSEPVCKLINAVSGAIGKVYEPFHIKRMADAKAYETEKLCEAIRNNSDLPICYENSELTIDASNWEDLVKRTGKRLAYQEVTRQQNIDSIVTGAANVLDKTENVSSTPVAKEWMSRFLNTAGDISAEELQELWSRILAGEVRQPNSYSIRTLECLRNINVEEARLFQKICESITFNDYLIKCQELMERNQISYADVLMLDEAGLLISDGNIVCRIKVDENPRIILDFGKYILVASSAKERELHIPNFPLTTAGRQISKLFSCNMNLDDIKTISKYISSNNNDINLFLHKIIARNGDIVNYQTETIDFL